MARYDSGLRGARHVGRPLRDGWSAERERLWRAGAERRFRQPVDRVTAAYNRDYVHPTETRYARNPVPFGGDRPGRIGDEGSYRYPYVTRGGTRAGRGASEPLPYDVRDFGPSYGGRYPDEL